ncbi:cholecystokinin receptor-like [Asterias amurensis]|uniref:cholecystokinin receptor-like n=1 Tax=Asterias amurensis TaxID=7602 RepID=UPI003AB46E5F
MALYTWFLVGLLCIVAIIGIPGNILVIVVYYSKTKRNGTRVFILALAGVDFFICALSSYRFYFWIEENSFSDVFVCRLFTWTGLASELSSAFVTTAVAVDRYLAICRPHLGWMTHARAQNLSIAGIIASAFLTLPAFLIYDVITETVNGEVTTQCKTNDDINEWVFIALFLIVIAFAGMMTLSLIMYLLIYREVRKRLKVKPALVKVAQVENTTEQERPPPMSSLLEVTEMDSIIGISLKPRQSRNTRRHSIGGVEGIASKICQAHQTQRQRAGSPVAKHMSLRDRFVAAATSRDKSSSLVNKRLTLTALGSSSEDTDNPKTKLNNGQNETVDQPKIKKNKTGKMLLLATVVFVVTWSARWIMWIISYLLHAEWTYLEQNNEVGFAFLILLQHLYYTTPAVNPAIYSFVNNRFREDCVKVLRRMRWR